MTRHEIATLACKIVAVWMFAQVAITGVYLPFFAVYAVIKAIREGFEWDLVAGEVIVAVPMLGMALVGLVLWFGAGRLARLMVSGNPTPITLNGLTYKDSLSIGFATVGAFTLASNVKDLAAIVVQINRSDYRFSEWWADADWQASFWSTILGLAFAIWLLLGSRGIARFVGWLRTAGASDAGQVERSTDPPARDKENSA